MFVHTILLAIIITFVNGTIRYPEYTYRDHPLYTLKQFAGYQPEPAVVNKYFYYHSGEPLLNRVLFSPSAVSYVTLPARQIYAVDADVLITPGVPQDNSNIEKFLEVHLNRPARVIALLTGYGLSESHLSTDFTINGAPKEWGPPTAIVNNATNATVLGDSSRWGENLFPVVGLGAAVELPVPNSLVLTLPHPSSITVAGIPILIYTLLFGQKEVYPTLTGFGKPAIPPSFIAPMSDAPSAGKHIEPAEDPPIPNRSCPSWLHDLHIAPTSSYENAKRFNEPRFWQTWHPPVDPIFWCYYTHEHGSYPGEYRPLFGMTAWKTPDHTEVLGRQNEPHHGFKVYAVLVPSDCRVLVITVHQLLSSARRFTERKHSVILTILDTPPVGGWIVKMELYFKMDFGAPEVTLANKTTLPNGLVGQEIAVELFSQGINAGRRFNVLNLEDFPNNVDSTYFTKGTISDGAAALARGVYEQWHGPPNTCSMSKAAVNRGFNFDVRDPSTAMRDPSAKLDIHMQQLGGKSTNRVLVLPPEGLLIGREFCNFSGQSLLDDEYQLEDGFYTDTYLTVRQREGGRFFVKQTVSKHLKTLFIPGGQFTPVSPWTGYMEPEEGGTTRRRFLDIERATIATEN